MGHQADQLAKAAATLGRCALRTKPGKRLPSLLFFTDPVRTPDPVAVAERLPRGSGVVFRAFGAAGARALGRRLAAVARRRGLILLIGADASLAAAVGAHGLHLPERLAARAPRLRRPGWIITAAAHSPRAMRIAARAGVDAVIVSPVFASNSPSAGQPIGPLRFAMRVRQATSPVYALGGITPKTARRLTGSGAVGLAAVEALAS